MDTSVLSSWCCYCAMIVYLCKSPFFFGQQSEVEALQGGKECHYLSVVSPLLSTGAALGGAQCTVLPPSDAGVFRCASSAPTCHSRQLLTADSEFRLVNVIVFLSVCRINVLLLF